METKLPLIVLDTPTDEIIPVYFRIPGRQINVMAGQIRVTGRDQVRLQPIVQMEPDRVTVHPAPPMLNERELDVQQLDPQMVTPTG